MIPADRLAELALGAVPTEAERAALAADPALAAELDELETTLGELPLTRSLPPPPGLRGRLLADTADPWWRALDAFAAVCDLGVAALKEVFRRARGEAWCPWPETGVELFHFDGGPATAGADVGFVRAAAGHHFPTHEHLGPESVVVMEGELRYADGSRTLPGQVARMGAGSTHDWVAGPEGVVFAVVVHGVRLLG